MVSCHCVATQTMLKRTDNEKDSSYTTTYEIDRRFILYIKKQITYAQNSVHQTLLSCGFMNGDHKKVWIAHHHSICSSTDFKRKENLPYMALPSAALDSML